MSWITPDLAYLKQICLASWKEGPNCWTPTYNTDHVSDPYVEGFPIEGSVAEADYQGASERQKSR